MKEIEPAYMSVPDLAVYLDCSVRTVERIIKEMKEARRYPARVFLTRPRRVRVKEFLDYCERGTT